MKTLTVTLVAILSLSELRAQVLLTLDQMIQAALEKNERVQASSIEIDYQKQVKRASAEIGPANVVYMRGQINSYVTSDFNLSIVQNVPFPTVITTQRALAGQQVIGSQFQKVVVENELVYQVKQTYYNLKYLEAREDLLQQEDSIYNDFLRGAKSNLEPERKVLLEEATAESGRREVQNRLARTQGQIVASRRLLQTLLNSEAVVFPAKSEYTERIFKVEGSGQLSNNPGLNYLRQRANISEQERKLAQANLLPSLNFGYFVQTLVGSPTSEFGGFASSRDYFQGFQVGLNIPLWFLPQTARIKAAALRQEYDKTIYGYRRDLLYGEWERAVQTYLTSKASFEQYKTITLPGAQELLAESTMAYRSGAIDYLEHWLSIQHVMKIRENHMSALNDVNQAVIYLEYLIDFR